jgi:hypothetical protein
MQTSTTHSKFTKTVRLLLLALALGASFAASPAHAGLWDTLTQPSAQPVHDHQVPASVAAVRG